MRGRSRQGGRGGWGRTGILIGLLVLLLAALALGQSGYEDVGLSQGNQRGPDPIQQMRHAWQQWRPVLIRVAAVLLLVAALWIIKPFRFLDAAEDRLLKRALRDVEDLLKRIQAEAETTSEDANTEESAVVAEGLLGGLAEVAEFSNAEQVPSYVLTVNDLMLDNIRTTLKRLRRFMEGKADRYQDYLFSVLTGMQTLTRQSAEGGVASGLAVDIREYFADDHRYQAWRKLLASAAKRGRHQEIAQDFLRFMHDLRQERPRVAEEPGGMARPSALSDTDPPTPDGRAARLAETPAPDIAAFAIAAAERSGTPVPPERLPAAEVPRAINEETLPALQQAAAREARGLWALVQTGRPPDAAHAWQFELVRRQQQAHLREEARRMLAVFLSHERRSLREVTKFRMLPCRTWDHILRLLGVEDDGQLHQRVEDKLLTVREILVLEKAFLQTFAKRESLGLVYGRDKAAGLMMDLHVPQIRRETLSMLRALHQTDPESLADATQALNDEETPQNNQVKRLIEHYVQHRHDPPGRSRAT